MYIFPKIMPVFTSLHVTLPLSTRILVAINEYLRHYGLLTFFLIIIVMVLFFIAQKSIPVLQLFLHRAMLKIPIFGKLFRAYNLANFCRTAGLLLKSGVQLSDTMVMVSETTKNLAYRHAFERVAQSVIRGEPMSRQLSRDPALFPDMLSHMVTVGEATGSLSLTLLYLSEMYEEDVEELTKNLSNAIEPVLMLVMGVLVGFIAVSIISPIYEITRNLSPH
jgi:type II secretory pathway component PulF